MGADNDPPPRGGFRQDANKKPKKKLFPRSVALDARNREHAFTGDGFPVSAGTNARQIAASFVMW